MADAHDRTVAPLHQNATSDDTRALMAVIDAAPIGVGLLDERLRYTVVNEALAAINGLSVADHIGRTVREVVPDLAHQVEHVVHRVWQTGVPELDIVVTGRTGATGELAREWSASFHRVDEPTVANGVGVVVTDVTERRRAERRLRQIIDGLFTFVGLCDPDGTLTEANRAALVAARLEPTDVIGLPFWDTYWWSYDVEVQERLRRAIERAGRGEATRHDVDVRVAGGDLLTIDFQLVPIVEDGRVTAIVASGIDIGERRRHERQLEATAELARALSTAKTTDDVVASILANGTAALDADLVEVALVDGHRVRVFHRREPDAGTGPAVVELALSAVEPICDAILTSRPVVLRARADHACRYERSYDDIAARGFGSILASPLTADGRAIGALGIVWRRDRTGDAVDDARLAIVSKLCAQTLRRTLRADRHEEFITTLQRQLLPEVPTVDGLDIAVSYEPAAGGIGFGGDWYDIVALDAHRTAFIVGDIAGHGIEAAAEMTVVRSAVNSLIRLGTPLESLLQRAHAGVVNADERFIGTLVVAIVDTEDDSCTYLTAGHPPPMMRTPEGGAQLFEELRNTPLGVRPDVSAVGRVAFGEGSSLVLYSDGLVERRGELIDVGMARLRDALQACDRDASTTSSELRGALCPASASWSDDVALIVVGRPPRSSSSAPAADASGAAGDRTVLIIDERAT